MSKEKYSSEKGSVDFFRVVGGGLVGFWSTQVS